MALYNESKRVNDFWSHDPKHVEAVFKVLAMSSGTAALVKVIAGPEPMAHFPHFESWRGAAGALVGLYLSHLIFRYADVALMDTYQAYREGKGRPISSVRYWFVVSCIVVLGMLTPAALIFLGTDLK